MQLMQLHVFAFTACRQLYVCISIAYSGYLPLGSHASFPIQVSYQNLFLAIFCRPLLRQSCSLSLCIFLLLLKHLYPAYPQVVKECSFLSWYHHKEGAKHWLQNGKISGMLHTVYGFCKLYSLFQVKCMALCGKPSVMIRSSVCNLYTELSSTLFNQLLQQGDTCTYVHQINCTRYATACICILTIQIFINGGTTIKPVSKRQ